MFGLKFLKYLTFNLFIFLWIIFCPYLLAKNIKKSKVLFYYTVKKGDTLYSIAKKFHTSVKKIKKLNRLKNNLIKPKQRLKIIGLYKDLNSNSLETKNIDLPYFYYVVKPKDNLYKIAKKFNVSLRLLKKFNHLKTSYIKPKQKLKIPQVYILKPQYINLPRLINHKVKKGESLYTISLKYNVPIKIIKKINNLNSNIILAGQIIKIPKRNFKTLFILNNYFGSYQNNNISKKFQNLFLSKSILDKEKEKLLKDKFLEISKQYRYFRYKYGGNGNKGYLDCSMFVKLVYEDLGISLPRTSREQFRIGISVNKKELIPGDLVFFCKNRKKRYVSHVGIYIGNNKFIHFSSAYKGLAISSLNSHYFRTHFIGAKRILNLNLFQRICKLSKNKES